MRIVFIGASSFGLKCLMSVGEIDNCELVGVVTAPKKFSISYRPEGVTNVLFVDFVSISKEMGLPCFVLDGGMNDSVLLSEVKSLHPDVFIVVGWYHMLPLAWREVAPAYGLHSSLLPDYSGGAPLVWAIINGEKRTGITLFELGGGVDNGAILGQKETPIEESDTIATLYSRIEFLGVRLIQEILPLLAVGEHHVIFQDDSMRRVFPQRSPEDGKIDWQWDSSRIYNFIRAQTRPYPGAFTFWKKSKLTIWSSKKTDDFYDISVSIGDFFDQEGRFFIKTGSGALEVLSLTYEGNDMSGVEFVRHYFR